MIILEVPMLIASDELKFKSYTVKLFENSLQLKSGNELKLKSEKLFENPLQWCARLVSGEVFAIINTSATKIMYTIHLWSQLKRRIARHKVNPGRILRF